MLLRVRNAPSSGGKLHKAGFATWNGKGYLKGESDIVELAT